MITIKLTKQELQTIINALSTYWARPVEGERLATKLKEVKRNQHLRDISSGSTSDSYT